MANGRTRIFSIRPALSFRGRKFKGPRGWAGKPLHPPLTDIPVAAYLLAAIFDVASTVAGDGSAVGRDAYVAATYVIVAGALASLGAVLTGFWDWWKGLDRDRSTGVIGRAKHTQVWRTANWHMALMLVTTAVVVADIAIRLGRYDAAAAPAPVTALSVIAAVIVSLGAVYGGALVYDYQFNVESLKGSTAWDETEVDQLPQDKPASEW
jgi:uncharacterized membrane protein